MRRRKWGEAFPLRLFPFSDRNNAHQIFLPAGLLAVPSPSRLGRSVPMWRRRRRAVAVRGAGGGRLGLRTPRGFKPLTPSPLQVRLYGSGKRTQSSRLTCPRPFACWAGSEVSSGLVRPAVLLNEWWAYKAFTYLCVRVCVWKGGPGLLVCFLSVLLSSDLEEDSGGGMDRLQLPRAEAEVCDCLSSPPP